MTNIDPALNIKESNKNNDIFDEVVMFDTKHFEEKTKIRLEEEIKVVHPIIKKQKKYVIITFDDSLEKTNN